MMPEWSQAVELGPPERWGVFVFVRLDSLSQNEIWALWAGPFVGEPSLDSVQAMYLDKHFKAMKCDPDALPVIP